MNNDSRKDLPTKIDPNRYYIEPLEGNNFKAWAPLKEGLLGTLLHFPDNSSDLKITTFPPCAHVKDMIFCISSTATFCKAASLMVQMCIKCK